jgi:pyrroloquinoline-quinone synthase
VTQKAARRTGQDSAASSEFVASLFASVRERRTFGRHPLWLRVVRGDLDRRGLQTFARQFFLQVREFPRAVSALHARCPYPEERPHLAENLYEEETGRLSGSAPHPELFLRFGAALGLRRDAMVSTAPLPATAALIDWFEVSTQLRSFAEGVAAITVAAEGQVPGAFGDFARALERHYNLSHEAVAFWDVHDEADRDHCDVGDHILARHTVDPAMQARVREALERSLDMWWAFFDGIDRACTR